VRKWTFKTTENLQGTILYILTFEMHRIYNTQPLSLTDSFEVAAAESTQMRYHVRQHDMCSE